MLCRLKHKVAVVRRLLSKPVGKVSVDDLVRFRMVSSVQSRPRDREPQNKRARREVNGFWY